MRHHSHRIRILPALFWAVLLCALAPIPTLAVDSQISIRGLTHRTWVTPDGVGPVFSFAQTTDGFIWVAGAMGIFRFDGNIFTRLPPTAGEPPFNESPYTLLAARDDGLWIGRAGKVMRWRNGSLKIFDNADGLPGKHIFQIFEDRDGMIWAGTESGLYKFSKERWRKIGAEDGLPDGRAITIMRDHENTLWVVIERRDPNVPCALAVLRAGETRFQLAADGLITTVKLAEAADGKIWTAQIGRSVRAFIRDKSGIQFVHPEIKVGSQDILFDRDGSLWIATAGDGLRRATNTVTLGSNDIAQFSDSVDKFTHEDGLSGDDLICLFEDRRGDIWVGTPKGLDRFHEVKPSLAVVRNWLTLLAVGFAALTFWGLYRLRLARMRARMRLQLEAQITERKRIAQELHDTLLQGFTGVGLKLEAIAGKLPDSLHETREQLRKILEQSDQYLTEARRSVWELRSISLEKTNDLAEALSESCRRRLEGTGIQFDFSVTGTPRKLPSAIEENLLRIGEEAVTNAAKHARPNVVRVGLAFNAGGVELRIRDNGRGFDPQGSESAKDGHFGLMGLQDRVRSVAGRLALNSQPGKGTEIIVDVPASQAIAGQERTLNS